MKQSGLFRQHWPATPYTLLLSLMLHLISIPCCTGKSILICTARLLWPSPVQASSSLSHFDWESFWHEQLAPLCGMGSASAEQDPTHLHVQGDVGNLTSKLLPSHWPGSPTNLCTQMSILSTPIKSRANQHHPTLRSQFETSSVLS